MGWIKTERIEHEVPKDSNLDLLLRGFHGIGNRLVDSLNRIGAGLQAIALAVSTPQDNSTEVQQRIDALASKLNLDATEQQDALDKFNQSKEKK